MEFSKDLEHLYISAGSGVWRVDGLGSAYTSDPAFVSKVGFVGTGANATVPTYTTATKITSTNYEGIAVNPNDDNDFKALLTKFLDSGVGFSAEELSLFTNPAILLFKIYIHFQNIKNFQILVFFV
jgi:hypothetical protein